MPACRSGDMSAVAARKRQSGTRHSQDSGADSGVGVSSTEKRFAYSLLEKLLEYVDKAALNMKNNKPASRFSRARSFSTATEDVKFFGKVCMCMSNLVTASSV